MPSIEVLLFAAIIVFTAFVIFGISGFGSTPIAVPLLAHLFPLTFVIPMVVVLDCVGSISMGLRLRANVNKRELVPLVPFMIGGMIAGLFLLLWLPAGILLATLGILVAGYGVMYVAGKQSAVRFGRWAAAPFGFFAGAISSTFGVAGPFYVMYLTGRGATPDEIRATMPVIFIFTTVGRIAIFVAAGLFTADVLYTSAALFPIMVLGIWLGNRLHLNLAREQLVKIIGVLLIVSGASLLAKAVVA